MPCNIFAYDHLAMTCQLQATDGAMASLEAFTAYNFVSGVFTCSELEAIEFQTGNGVILLLFHQ